MIVFVADSDSYDRSLALVDIVIDRIAIVNELAVICFLISAR